MEQIDGILTILRELIPLFPSPRAHLEVIIIQKGEIMSEKPETKCTHLDTIVEVVPSGDGCLECLRMGDTWVHLRLCLTCGHVGCCDNSKNKHATKHFKSTGHPIIKSYEPGEDWMWCYVDKVGFK